MSRWKTRAPLIAVGLFTLAFTLPRLAGLRINSTTSMPRGVYRSIGGAVRPGSIVAACLPCAVSQFGMERGYLGAGSCPDGVEPVVKVVAAVAGDVAEVSAQGVTVNGWPLPNSRPLDRDRGGRELLSYPAGPRRLEPGELWLSSPYEERSWDSRYFGPVPSECVTDVVVPLATMR